VEQEVGGSSPPNCTNGNNHLAKLVHFAGLAGVNTGVNKCEAAWRIA
jgi:hypothetical protein